MDSDKKKYLSGDELRHSKTLLSSERNLPQRGAKSEVLTGSEIETEELHRLLEERRELLLEEKVARQNSLLRGEWIHNEAFVRITKNVGKHFLHMGHTVNGQNVLFPEEAVFLMDINCMEVYYNGIPLSMQEAYHFLLADGLTFGEYQVYAHLSRLGYIVVRHQKRILKCGLKCDSFKESSSDVVKSDKPLSTISKRLLEISGTSCKRQCREGFSSETNVYQACLLVRHSECVIPCTYGKNVARFPQLERRFIPKNVCISDQSRVVDLRKCASKQLRNRARSVGTKRRRHDGGKWSRTRSEGLPLSQTRNQKYRKRSDPWNPYQNDTQRYSERSRYENLSHRFNERNQNLNREKRCSEWNHYRNDSQRIHQWNGGLVSEAGQRSFERFSQYCNFEQASAETDSCTRNSNEIYKLSSFTGQGTSQSLDSSLVPRSGYSNSIVLNDTYRSSRQTFSQRFKSLNFVRESSNSDTTSRSKNDDHIPTSVVDRHSCSLAPASPKSNVLVQEDGDRRAWFPVYTESTFWNDCEPLSKTADSFWDDSKDDSEKFSKAGDVQSGNAEHTETLESADRNVFVEQKCRTQSRVMTSAQCWKQYKDERCPPRQQCSTLPIYEQLPTPKIKPLLQITDLNDTGSILKKLSIVEQIRYDHFSKISNVLNISFDVYLPNSGYKKTVPSLPNHRLFVTSVEDAIPNMDVIAQTVNSLADNVPVHFAVVGNGDVAFYTFDDVFLPTYVSMG